MRILKAFYTLDKVWQSRKFRKATRTHSFQKGYSESFLHADSKDNR